MYDDCQLDLKSFEVSNVIISIIQQVKFKAKKGLVAIEKIIVVEEHTVRKNCQLAEQEVLALIAPLARLGCFQGATDFFLIDVLQLAYRVGRYEPIPPS